MKVLALVHESLIPPRGATAKSALNEDWSTEYHVIEALKTLGHKVKIVGLGYELGPLRTAVHEFKPHIVFNLLEEFAGEALFDHYIVSYLEMLGVKYTGCNPRGMMLARDKGITKKILKYHRIPTPDFLVFRKHQTIRIPSGVKYPLFVKTLNEEASLGISQESIVMNKQQLKKRVEYIFANHGVDAIAETFINGREFYVGVIGNSNLTVYPIWELFFDKAPESNPRIATSRVKWSPKYREKLGINTGPAKSIEPNIEKQIKNICKRSYKRLELSGYARMDLRLDPEKGLYLIEANPNPDIGDKEDLAGSVEQTGMEYIKLIQKILNLGLRW